MTGMSNQPTPTRVRIDFSFATALAVVAAVGAALVLAAVFGAASRPIGWALACAIVAALLYPIIEFLDRHMPHALAVIVTLLGLAVLLGGFYGGVAGTVADNIETLNEQAPRAAAELEADNEVARDFGLESRVTAFVEDLDERLGTRAQLEQTTSTVSTYVVTGVLTMFFIAYGNKLVAGALGQIRDEQRRTRVARVVHRAATSWRRYSLVAIGQAVVVTLLSWLVLWAIDLPAPFILGLLIGGFSVIPFAGAVVGGVPALLLAAGTLDIERVLAVVALVVAVQLFEVFVVRRRVDGVTLYVGPALPLIVALIGWDLYGLGGAIYSLLLLILALAGVDAVRYDGEGGGAADDFTDGDAAGVDIASTST
jgi:predicted PurR-regulated permease PerM